MKKLKLFFIICVIFSFKLSVSATSLSLRLDCPDTAFSGTVIECNVISNVKEGIINGINANYTFSNASYQKFTPASGWSSYNVSDNGFAIGNIDGSNGGKIGVISVLIKASSGSIAKINLINIGGSDIDYNDLNVENVSDTIKVIEKTTTTRTTTMISTTPTKKVIYINNIFVKGYDIKFNKNIFDYTLDVGYEVSNLNVSVSANDNYKVSGDGNININEGENTILIKVTDKNGDSTNYTIKVNRIKKASNYVNNNVEEMNNAFKSNHNLVVNLEFIKDELIVSREMLDLIKSSNRTLTYNIKNKGDILYSFIFEGNKFSDSYNDIDLTLDFNNTKNEKINESLRDKKLLYFKSMYNGFYPMGTKLKIKNMTKYHQESNMKLYKLNDEDSLELLKRGIKIQDDYMEFDIEKGDTYILSNKNTNSKNANIILIISTIVIFIEIIIVIYLLFKRKKHIELPKLKSRLENPNFIDDDEYNI